MILGDSLAQVAKDTTKKVSEYLTQGDVIDLFDKVHSFHNDEYMKFLTILSILLVVLGFIAVFITSRRIAATEDRLNRDSERNENRLNREIDHIRGENRRFQDSIDERIEERLSIKMNEIAEEFRQNISDNYDKFKKEKDKEIFQVQIQVDINQAQLLLNEVIRFPNNSTLKTSYELLYRAYWNSLKKKNYIYLSQIISYVKIIESMHVKFTVSEIDPFTDLNFIDSLNTISCNEIKDSNYKDKVNSDIELFKSLLIFNNNK